MHNLESAHGETTSIPDLVSSTYLNMGAHIVDQACILLFSEGIG